MARAVVLGAGFAGLASARVLAAHFDEVLVLEADALGDKAEPRRGVPQARAIHLMRIGGMHAVYRLFPGLEASLDAHGVPRIELGAGLPWYGPGGWVDGAWTDPPSYRQASRALLELCVRRELAKDARVTLRGGMRVTGLVRDGRRIAGALVRESGTEHDGTTRIDADLVVDASGRRSRTPEWLARLGFTAPSETTVDGRVEYLGVWLPARGKGATPTGLCMLPALPAWRRFVLMLPHEGDREMLSIATWGDERLPAEWPALRALLGTFPGGRVAAAVGDREPLEPPTRYRIPAARKLHYEKLRDMPDGLVVLGDAAVSFNPVYGQGMSVAVLSALRLGRALERADGPDRLDGLSRRVQASLSRGAHGAWLFATFADRAFPTTVGPGPLRGVEKAANAYFQRVLAVSARDARVARVVIETGELLRSPAALYEPRTLSRILRPWTRRVTTA